ncbi:hypothetical protein AALO_G00042100 [Alosa alosa]|uniref:Trichohyalin-like n=1 Tax=Alosa alosa TaxID=278164 RepID=A0AAV6H8M4_9TELE|nr:hypothetical protein AALO_G00042100 [Alosa alosa]
MQLNAVNHSKDQPMHEDEELPHGSPEGVPEEIKTYTHNVTVMIEGRDRRESCEEEEENVSGTGRGTDLRSESGAAEEEREGNRPRTDTENSQEEESLKQGTIVEDMHLHVQENHEMAVEASSVDKERNGVIVHPDQIEEEEVNGSELKEELPEVKQDLQEHLKEDTPKDEKENEQNDQREAELDPQTESLGEEEDSSTVQERRRTDKEEDIITKEQPCRENEQGSRTTEPQEKTEAEVLQDQTRNGGEQEPHVNKRLDEERTEEHEGEDGGMDPERKCPDEREMEMESAVEQGEGVDNNTNQREENELRHEDESDEDTVSVNSEQEYQLLKQGSDASLEEQQIDCQDVSVTEETNGEESEIKSVNEGTKANTPAEDKKQEGPAEDEEEDIITKEQPLRENEQGSRTPEPQEKTEAEVLQDQTRDGGEQEPHVNKRLDEERTEEHEGEDGGMDPCPDERDMEMESAVEQGEGVDNNTNQREENELRHEDESDEDTVSVNSEQEYQLLKQGSDTSLEEQQIDCQDVSVTEETNGEESEIKAVNEGTKANSPAENKIQEGQTPLKEGEDQIMPKEDTVAIEEHDRLPEDQDSLPEYQDHQDISVTDEMSDEESEIKSGVENGGVENNTQLEENRQGVDDSMPKEEPVALEEQDSLPEDQRIDTIMKTQDDREQDRKTEMMSNHGQAKDLLAKEFKEEQIEQDRQQNDTNSPVLHENEEDEEKTEKKKNEHSQEEERKKVVLPKSESEEEDLDTLGQLQNEEHLEHEGGEEERREGILTAPSRRINQ